MLPETLSSNRLYAVVCFSMCSLCVEDGMWSLEAHCVKKEVKLNATYVCVCVCVCVCICVCALMPNFFCVCISYVFV